MDTFQRLQAEEPEIDPDATEKLDPLFPVVQAPEMVTMVGPNGQFHYVQRGSLVHRVMRNHRYKELGQ